MVKYIELSQGKKTIVDDDWYEMLSQVNWHYCNGYARRNVRVGIRKQRLEKMSRVIMDAQKGMDVDHINRNKLDNRRENLRICTKKQNIHNKPGITGKYKGVIWLKNCNKWRAQILTGGVYTHLGVFTNEVEAAKAYNKAAKEFYKEFAYLNPIPGESL